MSVVPSVVRHPLPKASSTARTTLLCFLRYSLMFTLFCPSAFSQVPNDNTFSQMVLDRIIKDIIPPNVTGPTGVNYSDLQVNTVPTTFSKDSKYETWMLTRFVDTISPQGLVFKSTPKTLSGQYSLFIREIAIPKTDKALAPQLNAARMKYDAAILAYEKLFQDQDPNYKKFHENQIHAGVKEDDLISENQWLSQNYGDRLTVAQEKRDSAAQDWLALANQASAQYRDIANSVVAYDNTGNQRNVLIQDTEDRQMVRYYTAVPSIKEFVAQAETITGAGHSWSYNHNSGWSSTETMNAGASASYFGITIGGSGSHSSIKSSEDQFAFSLEFKHWGRSAIKPGEWFIPGVITEFKNGPFTRQSRADTVDPNEKFWNPETGVMPWMVSELVLVYKPTIKITMSHKTYEDIKTTFSGSAGISIGPFSFGASGGGTKEDIKWDDSSNTLTAVGADAPQILAVIQTKLPDFK